MKKLVPSLRATGLSLLGVAVISTAAGGQEHDQPEEHDAPRVSIGQGEDYWFVDTHQMSFETTVDRNTTHLTCKVVSLLRWSRTSASDAGVFVLDSEIVRVWAEGEGPTYLIERGDSEDAARRDGEPDVDFEARLVATGRAGGRTAVRLSTRREVLHVRGVERVVTSARDRAEAPDPAVLGLSGSMDDESERRRLAALMGPPLPDRLSVGGRFKCPASAVHVSLFRMELACEVVSVTPDTASVVSSGTYVRADPESAGAAVGRSSMSVEQTGRFVTSRRDGLPIRSEVREVTRREGTSPDCTMSQSGWESWSLRRVSETDAARLTRKQARMQDAEK